MPLIHVCSLQRLHSTVKETGARHIVTVIKNIGQVTTPETVHPGQHLKLDFSDIVTEQPGEVMADDSHVHALLDFVRAWDRANPMVVHCYAGVSRSTASAFIAACMLRPDQSETIWADALRKASPTATPNIHLVGIADRILMREGRMVSAIEGIGRGRDCFEGVPFSLHVGPK